MTSKEIQMLTSKLAAIVAAIVAVSFAGQLAFAPAANADPAPVRCKDVPSTFGSSHSCQFPDGSVTNCISSPLPIVGNPCSPVNFALAPNFWDTP
jgi:hypothetical protein